MKANSALLLTIIITLLFCSWKKAFSQPSFPGIPATGSEAGTDSFWVNCTNFSALPPVFRNGYVMLYKREQPGAIFIINVKGKIVWSYKTDNMGFKVVRYTKDHTLLCITGTKEDEIGYGNSILELSLAGDTLLLLKKGEADFRQTLHHDILLNSKNQIVTLYSEKRIFDLSSKGGSETDTVAGDGIQVLDKKGHEVWNWNVMDKINPLSDENILKNKKDWMHANSIAIAGDGNYLISFFNKSQVWKINKTSGNVMWKFGKGGDFNIPVYAIFDQAHAAHINSKGWLMFFDNGADRKISRSLAYILDEPSKRVQPTINAWLPPSLFTDRMGSSYLIGGNTLLVCASKHKTVALTDLRGNFLWRLNASKIQSYRAEFIPKEMLVPYLKNPSVTLSKK